MYDTVLLVIILLGSRVIYAWKRLESTSRSVMMHSESNVYLS